MIYVCFVILCLIILLQAIILWKYQRQVKDICRQLAFLLKHDSNMLISRELDRGGVGELVELLNDFLVKHRKEKKSYLEKEKMISDTYTNLSHDIRTPLTSLDGYFQLLQDSQSEEEQKRYFNIIWERIHSLKDMLEELFMFTKLKNDSYHLELQPCCVNKVLKETVFSYYEDWKAQGIEPEIEITEELLYIQGNEPGLRRVIQNIIKNGLDHGEKSIKIQLSQVNDGVWLKISNRVANPEDIDTSQVFERFYKADAARSKNSTGLGLSIAKELVIRMNGRIDAKVEGDVFGIEIEFPKISKRLKKTEV